MIRNCKVTDKEFLISDQEIKFFDSMDLPLPKISPLMRNLFLLAFRNDRNLYFRKCDFSGDKILSIYDDSHKFPVYKYDYWIGDNWSPPFLDYDKNKSFFSQFSELQKIAPRVNAFSPYNENCDYVNAAEKNKNCFMHILSDRSEDCLYTHGIFSCRDCIDCSYIYESDLCYECTDCRKAYNCKMCFLCDNSADLSFCFDMRGCQDCYFCNGLRNQRYCINNRNYTKEEYEQKMKNINLSSYSNFEKIKKQFLSEIVENANYTRMINTENCDGNFQINTKNCHHCYDIEDAEDCMYLKIGVNGIKDVHDSYAVVDRSQKIYNCVSVTESYNCHNIAGCWTTRDSFYSEFLQGCSDCIGCISLRYKKNCILNKEYSKEEYESIKKHIIAELGEQFGNPFPIQLAPFTYLDSAFSDYHTLSRDFVESIGWVYGDIKEEKPQTNYLDIEMIPDNINDFDENNLSNVYYCENSKKPFKIIEQEYKLLKKLQAPLPRKHYELRFKERVQFRIQD